MGVAAFPFGMWPIGLKSPGVHPGQGGYLLYRGAGADAANVDYDTPVGGAQAGDANAYDLAAGLAANTTYTYALRAVSDLDVEDPGEACTCRIRADGDGALAAARPNRLMYASRRAAAGGTIGVTFAYSRLGERAAAAAVQIAEVVAGEPDWDNALASVTLRSSGATRHTETVDGGFAHGETVTLALRAVTSGGVGGPVAVLEPVAADDAAPEPLAAITVEQSSD